MISTIIYLIFSLRHLLLLPNKATGNNGAITWKGSIGAKDMWRVMNKNLIKLELGGPGGGAHRQLPQTRRDTLSICNRKYFSTLLLQQEGGSSQTLSQWKTYNQWKLFSQWKATILELPVSSSGLFIYNGSSDPLFPLWANSSSSLFSGLACGSPLGCMFWIVFFVVAK